MLKVQSSHSGKWMTNEIETKIIFSLIYFLCDAVIKSQTEVARALGTKVTYTHAR